MQQRQYHGRCVHHWGPRVWTRCFRVLTATSQSVSWFCALLLGVGLCWVMCLSAVGAGVLGIVFLLPLVLYRYGEQIKHIESCSLARVRLSSQDQASRMQEQEQSRAQHSFACIDVTVWWIRNSASDNHSNSVAPTCACSACKPFRSSVGYFLHEPAPLRYAQVCSTSLKLRFQAGLTPRTSQQMPGQKG